jgi:hypothetical protein
MQGRQGKGMKVPGRDRLPLTLRLLRIRIGKEVGQVEDAEIDDKG